MSHLGGGNWKICHQGPNGFARDIAEEGLYHLYYLRASLFCVQTLPNIFGRSFAHLLGCIQDDKPGYWAYRRWQRCSAKCSFKRAMAMATRSASCRSSARVNLRSLMRFRIRSRASWNSLSSLACSGQLMARVEGEHIRHLLKTPRRKIANRRTKSKQYFRLSFAYLLHGDLAGPPATSEMIRRAGSSQMCCCVPKTRCSNRSPFWRHP